MREDKIGVIHHMVENSMGVEFWRGAARTRQQFMTSATSDSERMHHARVLVRIEGIIAGLQQGNRLVDLEEYQDWLCQNDLVHVDTRLSAK